MKTYLLLSFQKGLQIFSKRRCGWSCSVSYISTYLVSHHGPSFTMSSEFTGWIKADGSTPFPAEKGRYHLYVSLACPFAHRPIIGRALKGLEDVISMTIVAPVKNDDIGWEFTDKYPKCTLDPIHGCKTLREVYKKAVPNYSGRVTTPLLWDKKANTAVNNDSGELLRMLNSEFNEFCPTEEQKQLDLYPEPLREQIDEIHSWVVPNINLGVYKCGLKARTQKDYDDNITKLFDHLDKAEAVLGEHRFMIGDTFTEADVRLFTTLVRFDWVYHTHFKCNKKLIQQYENLWRFVRDIYNMPGVGETVDKQYIMDSYYAGHLKLNPFGIVPVGPDLDFTLPKA